MRKFPEHVQLSFCHSIEEFVCAQKKILRLSVQLNKSGKREKLEKKKFIFFLNSKFNESLVSLVLDFVHNFELVTINGNSLFQHSFKMTFNSSVILFCYY